VRRRERDRKFDEILARIDRNSEETRLYIRESGLRFERFMQQMDRRQDRIDRRMERLDRRMERLDEESRDVRARIEAQTKAIWALLDRWGYGPDNPPPEPA
jgi:hypothetical protein